MFKNQPVAMGVGGTQQTQQQTPQYQNPFQVNQFGNFKQFSAGAGSQIFKINKEGVFAGATNYTGAPFRLSYAGALTATSAAITGTITATGGSITGNLTVSGLLQAGSLSGIHADFGIYGSNAGLFFQNGETNNGGFYYFGSSGVLIDSIGNLYLSVGSGKSLAFSVDSVLKASISSGGKITAVDGFAKDSYDGQTGTFEDGLGNTIYVKGGIITAL